MKKLLLVITLIALILATASYVSAKSTKAAIVIHDDWCLIPDASGSFVFDDLWLVEDCCTTVITNSATGAKKISCSAELPEGAQIPEETIHFNYKNTGFECWWDEYTTTQKYQFTLTPTGRVNFHCVFKD